LKEICSVKNWNFQNHSKVKQKPNQPTHFSKKKKKIEDPEFLNCFKTRLLPDYFLEAKD
jgi:hypothetical protein